MRPVNENEELIAKVHFWFGQNEDIFKTDLIVEDDGTYTYIYRRK